MVTKKTTQATTQLKPAVRYSIIPKDLAGHLFQVTMTVDSPAPEGQILSLPAWIPGSYMIREFSRNIVQIKASSDSKRVTLKKLDKHTWQAARCKGPLEVVYEVYAWDLSVRAAHLDQQHGFFNGTSVFLCVHGKQSLTHVVDIQRADHPACSTWRVATAMKELNAERYGFGTYIADNYDELIDHPVEMGNFSLATFHAHGVSHDFVVSGKIPNFDMERVVADVKKICEYQIGFFEPRTKQAPMDRYVFMTMVVGDGYGGLEHRASTALMCNRSDLPVRHHADMSDAYRNFLGLCSHEYFHTWNVKRIKPTAFANYDLSCENYTSLLWVFEGFTSYYDDLVLVRAGVIDESAYLKLISKTINTVTRGSGRLKQSVAESSFDAWTKYYRQDENSPNAIVSYYTKGSLVALGLDLLIRTETGGKKSLDDVMRAMWKRFGRDFYQQGNTESGHGVNEEDISMLIEQATGINTRQFLQRYVHGTSDVPLAKLYAEFGIALEPSASASKPSLGIRVVRDGNDCRIANVYEGRAAHVAGLSAQDVLIAINGLRVTAADAGDQLSAALGRYRVGEKIQLHVFRRDELMIVDASLQIDDAPAYQLRLSEETDLPLLKSRPSFIKKSKRST
ncbi:M61 family metallopeptidase [Undibacterium sp. SXout7W]|uniref:M61 family metallopeptidase n=1 Tax=Undibacterium sp. SXout7W TaxID=3413049 RepID=UPI003BF20367